MAEIELEEGPDGQVKPDQHCYTSNGNSVELELHWVAQGEIPK